MGANSSKTSKYYDQVQKGTIDISDLDPLEVFGLKQNYEWDELKESYRRIAKIVHPDKGGSEVLFNKVTECFKKLALEYKMRQVDRPHHELKREFFSENSFDIRGMPSNPLPPISMEGNFADRFNKAFDENKLEDDTMAGGYGNDMAKSTKNREDIAVPKLFKGSKVNAETFNKTFDTVTLSDIAKKEVVVYKEPEALPLGKTLAYTELGADKPSDYSSSTEGTHSIRSLQYTDYMKAHSTTRLVDPRSVQKKQEYRNVDEYEAARGVAMAQPATTEELRYRALKDAEEKRKEEDKQRRLAAYDNKLMTHHAKVSQLFIK